jgi:superfamily II DNA or RNA helicase
MNDVFVYYRREINIFLKMKKTKNLIIYISAFFTWPSLMMMMQTNSAPSCLSALYWVHRDSIKTQCSVAAIQSSKNLTKPIKECADDGVWWPQTAWSSELSPRPATNALNPIPSKPLQLAFAHPTDKNWIGVPRFWGIEHIGIPREDRRCEGNPLSAEAAQLALPLRPIQQQALEQIIISSKACGGAFVQADCGFGKTPTALAAIAALGRKAMFVCNRTELMHQAVADIQGMPRRWPDGTLAPIDKSSRRVCEACAEGRSKRRRKQLKSLSVSPAIEAETEICCACSENAVSTSMIEQSVLPLRPAWLPGARVALLQGQWLEDDKREQQMRDADIIVCCVNSLASCTYPSWLTNSIGTVVVDEAHHIAALTLSQALPRLPARYIIGVSATPQRSDGLERVLYWLLGPLCFTYQRTPETTGVRDSVKVKFIEYRDGPQNEITYKDGRLGFAAMTVALSRDEKRNALLKQLTLKAVQEDGRQRILVLTSFREHLVALASDLRRALGHSAVAVLHGTATVLDRAHARASSTRVIVATYSFVEEGYDDDALDTLILATPRSRIQQSVGRIERTRLGKAVPLVIDVVDTWSIYARMRYKRKTFYKSRGFLIL